MSEMADIIVVNFNTKHFMSMIIDSIYKWTPAGTFNLYVVDNGSTDGSVEHLREKCSTQGFYLIELPKNLGVGPAVNHVIKMTVRNGNDVVLIHSDVEIRGWWLSDMQKLLTEKVGQVEAKVQIHNNQYQFGGQYFFFFLERCLQKWDYLVPNSFRRRTRILGSVSMPLVGKQHSVKLLMFITMVVELSKAY